ncbi:MAG TPA: Tat pathway signal protein [Bryobacteraceae bacterium]|nr:Tat pathway signal protein [Bryobacteraceae bacterium]
MTFTRGNFLDATGAAVLDAAVASGQSGAAPWYARCYRWAQINTSEKDVVQYDLPWWREQWKRTAVQGLFVNAAGTEFTQYPSKFPLQRRNRFLPDRDLFGEITEAAHRDGLVVVARMDSSGVGEGFFQAHPDWFTRTRDGQPGNGPCINSPYREEYVPGLYREIIERSRPEGFMDNGGFGGAAICYCENCARRFRDQIGKTLPNSADWNDPVYREWVRWGQARQLEIWDLNNRVTKAAGGPNCVYVGLVRKFQANTRAIAKRSPLLLADSQSRNDEGSFRENADEARYMHSLVGWNSVVSQSMALYHHSHGYFRFASDPPAEARMYMLSGMAGGFQPWYHHIGAYGEDRRMYHTAEPVMLWHKKNERYLVNRTPVATVGVVRSELSSVFYGRGAAPQLMQMPYRGMVRALFRTRIPYLPVHIDDIEPQADRFAVLVLPNIGGMSDEQCAVIRRFVERGGSLIATGVTSLYDADGEPRADFGLAPVFGAHLPGPAPDRMVSPETLHSYLRLRPELRASVFGPHVSDVPRESGPRHPALAGFDETDLLAFGGSLTALRVDPDRIVLCTFVPPFPTYPPETAWMRQERTDIPGLIVGSYGKGKVAFLPADLDRRYMLDTLPDHGRLLGNLLRWTAGDNIPFTLEGSGYIGAYLYRQENRLILHLVNGTGTDNGEQISDEYFPIGPLKIRVRLPDGVKAQSLKFQVSERVARPRVSQGSVEFQVPRLIDHELVVIE